VLITFLKNCSKMASEGEVRRARDYMPVYHLIIGLARPVRHPIRVGEDADDVIITIYRQCA
jgi:hypothetical protein